MTQTLIIIKQNLKMGEDDLYLFFFYIFTCI